MRLILWEFVIQALFINCRKAYLPLTWVFIGLQRLTTQSYVLTVEYSFSLNWHCWQLCTLSSKITCTWDYESCTIVANSLPPSHKVRLSCASVHQQMVSIWVFQAFEKTSELGQSLRREILSRINLLRKQLKTASFESWCLNTRKEKLARLISSTPETIFECLCAEWIRVPTCNRTTTAPLVVSL